MTNEFLTHPAVDSLENHSDKLKEIMKVSKSIMDKFQKDKSIGHKDALTKDHLVKMETILNQLLNKTGDLSLIISDIQNELSDHYSRTYIKTPAIGKKLFLTHFTSLHKPYDKVKDILWKTYFIINNYREKTFN